MLLVVSLLRWSLLSYPVNPPTMTLLIWSILYPESVNFCQYPSTTASLCSKETISLVFIILLVISWFSVIILMFSGMALTFWMTQFEAIGFS